MDKIIYLAVAGSGKTYDLCNSINRFDRNLIIAFTNENIKNIRKEIMKKFGYIPDQTEIMTYHSFINKDFLMPYEYIAWNKMEKKEKSLVRSTKGISIKDPPLQRYNNKKNPLYIKDNFIEHYLEKDSNKYYCSRISKLINKCGKSGILNKSIKRLEKYYDNIFIDEFQDFRKEDYKLLNELIKKININCYLYGDFYQHSVSGKNKFGKPFSFGKKIVTYEEFIEKLELSKFVVDTSKLKKSRRCSKNVCDYIRDKLDINIFSEEINEGIICNLKDEERIEKILLDNNIIKLFYKNAKKEPCRSINWGYSKGNTYDETCIILPKDIDIEKISSKNMYYVALTRSKGNVYILDNKKYKKIKEKIFKKSIK